MGRLLMYATSLCDVVLLVTIASVGAKAESTLVIVFFLILASTFLRFSTKLTMFATALCIGGYLVLVCQTEHFWIEPTIDHFPFLEVFRTVAGLAVMGLIGWQLCKGCRFGLESLVSYERAEGSDNG